MAPKDWRCRLVRSVTGSERRTTAAWHDGSAVAATTACRNSEKQRQRWLICEVGDQAAWKRSSLIPIEAAPSDLDILNICKLLLLEMDRTKPVKQRHTFISCFIIACCSTIVYGRYGS
ncbi:hypothetical protein AAHA92_31466 [Salvia divinorum]|uniref:Uncharacterized protein n=1 Tax=Salvia divinorum TaxID=28513 RepID=A0ABD1FQH4_SALDI